MDSHLDESRAAPFRRWVTERPGFREQRHPERRMPSLGVRNPERASATSVIRAEEGAGLPTLRRCQTGRPDTSATPGGVRAQAAWITGTAGAPSHSVLAGIDSPFITMVSGRSRAKSPTLVSYSTVENAPTDTPRPTTHAADLHDPVLVEMGLQRRDAVDRGEIADRDAVELGDVGGEHAHALADLHAEQAQHPGQERRALEVLQQHLAGEAPIGHRDGLGAHRPPGPHRLHAGLVDAHQQPLHRRSPRPTGSARWRRSP